MKSEKQQIHATFIVSRRIICIYSLFYQYLLLHNCAYCAAVFCVDSFAVNYSVASYFIVVSLSGLEALYVYNL